MQLQGIDPSKISKAELEAYGISEEDLNSALSKFNGDVKEEDKIEIDNKEKKQLPIVEKDSIVKPSIPFDEKNSNKDSIYGRSFFRKGGLSVYEKATHNKAPDNYILGAGDEIGISIWGYSEHNGKYLISKNGSISPRLVGRIYLRGVTLAKARKILASRFGKVYDLKNSQINVEVNYSKVIRVNIVGEVEIPGTYSLNSINSAFNVLAQSGGVNSIGSVRSIKIIRSGKLVKELDLYEFLAKPTSDNDCFLLDNDYLVVSPVLNLVKLEGLVNRPMYYEIKNGETISDLIKYAGGFQPTAYTSLIHVNRVFNNQISLLEFDLSKVNKESENNILKNGDHVKVLEVAVQKRNYVSISGAVNIPGEYSFSDSLTIKELIRKSSGLKLDAYLDKIMILRRNSDLSLSRIPLNLKELYASPSKDLKLSEFDEIVVYSKNDFIDDYKIEIKGAVRNPQEIIYSNGITLSDIIFMSGGFKNEASSKKIEISRVFNFEAARSNDNPTRIIIESIDVSKELNLTGTFSKYELKPMDIITVRNIADFEIQQNINISGEVKYPGQYTLLSKKETLKEIIERSGGLTQWAFIEGATIKRTEGEVNFMILDLKALLKEGNEEFNYVLRAGDSIIIPKIQNLISLSGAFSYPKILELGKVYAPFKTGKRASYFVDKFGAGFADEADRSSLIVTTPGGYVKRTKRFFWIHIYPKVNVGDEISVKLKPTIKKETSKDSGVDWNKTIESITIKATGILTVLILTQQAFTN